MTHTGLWAPHNESVVSQSSDELVTALAFRECNSSCMHEASSDMGLPMWIALLQESHHNPNLLSHARPLLIYHREDASPQGMA